MLTSRRHFLPLIALIACGWHSISQAADAPSKPNVLFIAIDDLRPQLGCYGDKLIHSPSIDRLAASGLVFTRAYCQQAVCSPSRTSLLTGRRPDTTKVYDLETHFRDTIPDVVTLPQYFKNHGYFTQGISKIYHGGLDDKASWSVPWSSPEGRQWQLPESAPAPAPRKAATKKARAPRGPAFESADAPDSAYPDGNAADQAIAALQKLKGQPEPFFLAVGFLKPHLPFCAPKKYWDLYDHDAIKLPTNDFLPKDAPEYAGTTWGELRSYRDVPASGPVSDDMARNLIHGYYASISFTDAQVGRLLDELDRLDLTDNTLVILWGDHGWKLGEHSLWCKHTNFELDAHSTLVLRVPGAPTAGRSTAALTEFVDIYPSLCELAGLPAPQGVEGTSFAPLVQNPDRPWKTAAFSQYPRSGVMGYTMKTNRFRYTEWKDTKSGEVRARELYDHQADPAENTNLADHPAQQTLVTELGQQLNAGWKAAIPAPSAN